MIEAGLGGRYDATNVIPSRVQVLTSVGLEHTRWLGPTITDIAAREARRGHARRDAGARRPACIRTRSRSRERSPRERGATLVQAGSDPGVAVGALGAFQRRNFALAMVAAQAYLGELDERAVAAAAAEIRVPGRLQIVGEDPLTLVDGAHNPEGMAALAESLPELVAGHEPRGRRRLDPRRQGRCRDARVADADIATRSSSPAVTIPGRCRHRRCSRSSRQLHGPPAEIVRDPEAAVRRARELAGRRRRRRRDRIDLPRRRPGRARRARPRLDAVNDRRRPAQLPDDDRARGADRRDRDPRVLRDRLPVRTAVSVTRRNRFGTFPRMRRVSFLTNASPPAATVRPALPLHSRP